ncbi:MAG: hypothetical protein COT15_04655 [Candidatus Diapherotrites archaeon CG08_land_8_20_14_0_20_34_12]|nr:MAG: hypothetical protein COT15_04655 [Candidatus Diapherotrites archaeon CG08_land_8_20_14_0_20_34_12]
MPNSKTAEKLVSPTMKFLTPIPPIAWIPLIIIIFRIGEASKIALITFAVFVVIYINTFQGIRAIDLKLVEVAKAFNKNKKNVLFKVILPAATPNILIGMRVALDLAWILLIASELIASSKGLGWLIWDSRNFSRADDMIVGMLAIGILGFFTNRLLALLERKLLVWRNSFQGE